MTRRQETVIANQETRIGSSLEITSNYNAEAIRAGCNWPSGSHTHNALIALFVSAKGLRDAAHVSLELEQELPRNRLQSLNVILQAVVISGTHAAFISTNIRL